MLGLILPVCLLDNGTMTADEHQQQVDYWRAQEPSMKQLGELMTLRHPLDGTELLRRFEALEARCSRLETAAPSIDSTLPALAESSPAESLP